MSRINLYINFLFLFGLLSSCNQIVEQDAFVLEEGLVQMYFQGKVVANQVQEDFLIEIGKGTDGEVPDRLFLGSRLFEGTIRPQLQIGVYTSNFNQSFSNRPRIEFQFWPGNVGSDQLWDKEEVRSYFEEGKSFSIGKESDDVFRFSVLLPLSGEPYDFKPSATEFLASPQGYFQVTSIEDYEYSLVRGTEIPMQGLLVRGIVEAEVGRYDRVADDADGNPNFFRTNEVVEFQEGEVSFYVPYNQEL